MIRYSLSCAPFDTHANVSVLSAHGSLRIASASPWLDPCAGGTNARRARTRSAPDTRCTGESLMFSPLFLTAFVSPRGVCRYAGARRTDVWHPKSSSVRNSRRLLGEPHDGVADVHMHPLEPRAVRMRIEARF